MTTNTTESAFEANAKLEEAMRGMGVSAYKARLEKARAKGAESETDYGQTLISASIDRVAEGLRQFLTSCEKSAGRRHAAYNQLVEFDPDVAAFIALRVVLDTLTKKRALTSVVLSIANALEEELRIAAYRDADKRAYGYTLERVSKATSRRHKRRVFTHEMNAKGVVEITWTADQKSHTGRALIDIIRSTTGLIDIVSVQRSKRECVNEVVVSEKTLEWINGRTDKGALLAPLWMPTIVPPKPWTGMFDGGYHTRAVPRFPLVKSPRKAWLEELNNRAGELPAFLQTANALQETAFRINQRILDVALAVHEQALPVSKLPPVEDLPMPLCPCCGGSVESGKSHGCFDQATPDYDAEAHREWKREAAIVHEANAKMVSKRLQMQKILYVARQYAEYPAIYFPHQADWRGRWYAVPQYLNPQGCDMAKGLLTFAQGKPIEEDSPALGWLFVHLANSYGKKGVDKRSFDGRIKWVEENIDLVQSIAADPIGTVGVWGEADSPFQFLAACFEVADFLDRGWGFVSTLPIGMDGSCNGLQHLSAMLRDEVGGAAVNLLPSDKPSDIYQVVWEKVKERIEVIAGDASASDDDRMMAGEWLAYGGDRKLTKRAVMTMPYGSTRYRCSEYIADYIADREADAKRQQDERQKAGLPAPDGGYDFHPWGKNTMRAAHWMGGHVWAAIGDTVVKGREAMVWMQKAARLAAEEGLPINWRTPTGYLVQQAYPDMRTRMVQTYFGDKTTKVKVAISEPVEGADGQSVLSKDRQANGVSPNVVHSLDSAHLSLSVERAIAHGVSSFAMVHDSYAVCAADAPVMATCLRQAFVDMYESFDPLTHLRDTLLEYLSPERAAKLDPIPSRGILDLHAVLESDYFFA